MMFGRSIRRIAAHGKAAALLAALLITTQIGAAPTALADPARDSEPTTSAEMRDSKLPILVAQAETERDPRANRPLEPRYQPREPEEKSFYNSGYIFGMTRGVADSTIHPAGKAPLFVLTIPLDIALLPFTVIGGLFG